MRSSRLLVVGVLFSAVTWCSDSAADVLSASADGWHSWQVDEPATSIEMCCYTWRHNDRSRGGCNLDDRNISFSSDGDCSAAPGSIQVYVRLDNGTPRDIRLLSSNCPVTAESEITDHGLVSTDDNISWFVTVIENDDLASDVREEALFALASSSSDAAYAYLDRLLTKT